VESQSLRHDKSPPLSEAPPFCRFATFPLAGESPFTKEAYKKGNKLNSFPLCKAIFLECQEASCSRRTTSHGQRCTYAYSEVVDEEQRRRTTLIGSQLFEISVEKSRGCLAVSCLVASLPITS